MKHKILQERQDTLENWFKENSKDCVSSFYMERSYGPDGSTCTVSSGEEGELIDGLIGWLINRVMKGHLCLEELVARLTVCYYLEKRRQEELAKEADNT